MASKKNLGRMLIMVLTFGLVLYGCSVEVSGGGTTETITYYDYGGVKVPDNAIYELNSSGFYRSTVYYGSRARTLLEIIASYHSASNPGTLHEKKTYTELITWLNNLNLPHEIAAYAKDSITAYCYYGTNNELWVVFAEDVSADYRSATLNGIREGYQQTEAVNK
jgi:hypothetical protein